MLRKIVPRETDLRNFRGGNGVLISYLHLMFKYSSSILKENAMSMSQTRCYEVGELRIFHSHKIFDINYIDEWTSRFAVRAIALCKIPRSRPLARCVAV